MHYRGPRRSATCSHMDGEALEDLVGPALAKALATKGYATLTAVQKAVLDPALAGRDLRVTSQTGSGKTVAIGFALRDLIESPAGGKRHWPACMVVAPTRELAKQVEDELRWLFAPLHARIASTTGGTSYVDERRALAAHPAIVVGTPGRLLDHLRRGSVDATHVGAIVLDEADRMLDLGFQEELEAILEFLPEGHRTHLVSATFPREVRQLADSVQKDPAHVEGTRLGSANQDITHLIHLVAHDQRLDAIVNLMLANPDEQTLIFVKTRADVSDLTRELASCGFRVTSLSGDMEQPERNRALAAFKNGACRVLVATDVAARGLDVQGIGRVIHADPPNDPDAYTHRSGRTGRAGRQGTSSVLVAPVHLRRLTSLLDRARVQFKFEPIPTPREIHAAAESRLFEELTAKTEAESDDRIQTLAKRLAGAQDPALTIARLLERSPMGGATQPREVRVFSPPPPRGASEGRVITGPMRKDRAPRAGGPSAGMRAFRVTWGRVHGADARRLLAVVCRRGKIRGSDVGAIVISPTFSVVEVAGEVADGFAQEAMQPDPRDPRIVIRPENDRQEREPRPGSRPKHARAPSTPRADVELPPPPRSRPKAEDTAPRPPWKPKGPGPRPAGGDHPPRRPKFKKR